MEYNSKADEGPNESKAISVDSTRAQENDPTPPATHLVSPSATDYKQPQETSLVDGIVNGAISGIEHINEDFGQPGQNDFSYECQYARHCAPHF